MMRWIRAFLIFFRHSPVSSKALERWTDSDSVALAQFYRTSAGKKFLEMLRRGESDTNATAVLRHNNLEYACGWAAGFRGCSAWIQSLSVVGSPQEVEEDQLSPRGAEDLAESLAP